MVVKTEDGSVGEQAAQRHDAPKAPFLELLPLDKYANKSKLCAT